jgi:uncharacterized protein (TIGR03437 family)
VAGTVTTDSGDGGPGPAARLFSPQGLARDKAGNLYIADYGNHRVRVLRPNGTLEAFAGTGAKGFGGDGGPAKQALLDSPSGLAVTTNGTVYILDGRRIRRVSPEGEISSVTGPGLPLGPPRIPNPTAIAADDTNLFVADSSRSSVFRIDGDGKLTTYVKVERPTHLALAPDGSLYIADTITLASSTPLFPRTAAAIEKMTLDGVLHPVVGSQLAWTVPQDGMDASLAIPSIIAIAVDAQGNLVFADGDSGRNKVFRVGADLVLHQISVTEEASGMTVTERGTVLRSGYLHTVSEYQGGNPGSYGFSPSSVLVGQVYSGDAGDGGPATEAKFGSLASIVASPSGEVFIADPSAWKIRKVDHEGRISTAVAGVSAGSLAISPAGELYFSVRYGVSKVSADGTVTAVAGNGQPPSPALFMGDRREGARATDAAIGADSLAFDRNGSLYFSDKASTVVWKVTPDGVLHMATQIQETLSSFMPVAADGQGSVWYLNDRGAGQVLLKKIGADKEPAEVRELGAMFSAPSALAIDVEGNVFVTRWGYPYVRRVGPTGRIVSLTDSGAHGAGSLVDLSFDLQGNLFVLDSSIGRVWKIDSASTCSGQRFPIIGGIVNNASFLGPAAPGEMVAVFGLGVGPDTPAGGVVENGRFSTAAGDTQLLVDGVPAPMIYASASQSVGILPFGTEGQSGVTIALMVDGLLSDQVWLSNYSSKVGLFTRDSSGTGPGSILNEDYTVNSAERPAKRGSVIMVYATGLGPLNPVPEEGVLAGPVPPVHTQAYAATIGGRTAEVLYAGAASGLVVGVSQINVRVPTDAPAGAVPIKIQPVDDSTACSRDGVTVYVE